MNELINVMSDAPLLLTVMSFACRIRRKQGRDNCPSSSDSGEVELENVSSVPVEIELEMSPFQHLNLVVTDSQGEVVSEGHYGNRFSPSPESILGGCSPDRNICIMCPF
jgi:hypothetical protein